MFALLAKIIVSSLLFSSSLAFLVGHAAPQNIFTPPSTIATAPKRINPTHIGIETTAQGIMAIDDKSGATVYEKNSSGVFPIASITKLMTALVILDTHPDWNKIVTLTKDDQRLGNIQFVLSGDQITMRQLFDVMLTASANEAAIALARNSGLTDFVAAMNHKAHSLGMNSTHFVEPSGLDSGNVSSAHDLIRLAQAAFAQPDILQAVHADAANFTITNTKRAVHAVTTDRLLGGFLNNGPYRIIAAKTGHIDEAGYCLVVRVQQDSGPTITLALLKADTIQDRWQETKGIIDWVMYNYQWPTTP